MVLSKLLLDLRLFKEYIWNLANNNDVSVYEIENYIHHFFLHKPIPIVEIKLPHYCRCSINKPGEVFKNVSRCSYNPDSNKIDIQRCNYEGQKLFYVSSVTKSNASCTMTAILETAWAHIEDKDIKTYYMTMSRWMPQRPFKMFIFPFSKKSISSNKDFKTASENMHKIVTDTYGVHEKEAIQYWEDSLEFISDALCEKENKRIWYRITSAFFNCIQAYAKAKNNQMDGMIYPSANSNGEGLNAVFKKEIIDDRYLICDYVMMYKLQRNPNDPKHITFNMASTSAIPNLNGDLHFKRIF